MSRGLGLSNWPLSIPNPKSVVDKWGRLQITLQLLKEPVAKEQTPENQCQIKQAFRSTWWQFPPGGGVGWGVCWTSEGLRVLCTQCFCSVLTHTHTPPPPPIGMKDYESFVLSVFALSYPPSPPRSRFRLGSGGKETQRDSGHIYFSACPSLVCPAVLN